VDEQSLSSIKCRANLIKGRVDGEHAACSACAFIFGQSALAQRGIAGVANRRGHRHAIGGSAQHHEQQVFRTHTLRKGHAW